MFDVIRLTTFIYPQSQDDVCKSKDLYEASRVASYDKILVGITVAFIIVSLSYISLLNILWNCNRAGAPWAGKLFNKLTLGRGEVNELTLRRLVTIDVVIIVVELSIMTGVTPKLLVNFMAFVFSFVRTFIEMLF